MKYSILFPPVRFDGKDHHTDIELTDEVAQPLLAIGVIGKFDPNAAPALSADEDEIEEDGEGLIDGKLNLNTATEDDLIALKYVSKSVAQKLIKGQSYQSVLEAQLASGLKPEQWAEIEGGLTV